MPLEIPNAVWPTSIDRETVNRTEVINDHTDIQQHSGINAWRDVLRWEIDVPATGVNVSYELFPHCQHGVAVEIRVNAKAVGAGSLTATVKSNGNVLGSCTTGSTALAVAQIFSSFAKLLSTDKQTLDLTVGAGAWGMVIVELIIEPTTEVS